MEQPNLENDYKMNLINKREAIMKNSCFDNHKYFHLQTVHNLIFHLDKVKFEEDKLWIYATLNNYLTECSNYINILDRKKSNELFNEYLDKITDYYSKHLGFRMIISRIISIGFYSLLSIIFFFVFSIWIAFIPILIYMFQAYTLNKKIVENKVYGLFY